MSEAGQLLVAGRIPGERIATEIVTADSATFTTTEVELASVTAPTVAGRTYWVRCFPKFESDTADDRINVFLREDDVNGTAIQSDNVRVLIVSNIGWGAPLEAPFTAATTESKTFSLTAVRAGGSGNCFLGAAPTRPVLLYVDYISG